MPQTKRALGISVGSAVPVGRLPTVTGGSPVPPISETERRTALAHQLLERYGIVTREAVHAEGIVGGFSAVYEVLKAMEESGRVRRGYFIAGLGATQFALPGTDERLRAMREEPEESRTIILAATDPANPYGASVPWPQKNEKPVSEGNIKDNGEIVSRPQRSAGARVILKDGLLIAWLAKNEKNLLTFVPDAEPQKSSAAEAIVLTLAELMESETRRAVLISAVDGQPPHQSFLASYFSEAGFVQTSRGYLKRRAPVEGKLVYDA